MITLTLPKIDETTIDNRNVDFISSLPSEISKYILCYLSRSNIDNCRLVCKNWDTFIKSNSKSLPKRQYKKIKISSRSVFQIFVKENNMKSRQWNFEKKVISCDINRNLRKRKYIDEVNTPSNEYTVVNKDNIKNIFTDNNITNDNEVSNNTFIYKINSSIWEEIINLISSQSSDVYSNIFSQSMNYTPVKKKNKKNTLEFEEITLTDEIIDGIIEVLKKATIGILSISFVKLTYCTPLKFLNLFDRLNLNVTRGYRVNWARMARNEHFSINDIVQKLHLNERKISKQKTLQILDLGLLTDFNNDTIITNFNIKEVKMLLNTFCVLRIDGSNINLDILKELMMEWRTGYKSPKIIYLSNCPLTTDLNTQPKIIEFSKELGVSVNKNGETLILKGNNKSLFTLKTVKHPNFGDQLRIVFQ
ncbi:F-box domain-containing protein [Strongyloides ratti]|uniref:F-box domain-containing protein n=1 Tax=Strongyloides ratti TaxID=34506 RepID=A0A090L650_STRRB|nr:F-box domain-containing protein [Strongyloides ratti]CEF62999.1 F-box domain-containing protein [Strongyloides ratti]